MKKILVVEDNEDNIVLVTRFLNRGGFAVVHAADGIAGIEQAQAEEPDLILMDLSLPKLDGWEATRRIKSAPETRHIPIIALTAHAFESDLANAVSAGCDGYETKPIVYFRLIARINTLLQAADSNSA